MKVYIFSSNMVPQLFHLINWNDGQTDRTAPILVTSHFVTSELTKLLYPAAIFTRTVTSKKLKPTSATGFLSEVFGSVRDSLDLPDLYHFISLLKKESKNVVPCQN